MRKVYIFNNCFPSDRNPTLGTYVKTISDAIVDAGYEVSNIVLYRTSNKLIDYLKYYYSLLTIKLPADVVLYINHYTMLLPLILRLIFLRRHLILHWHGEELLRDGKIYVFLRFLIKKTFSDTTIHIAPSHYYKEIVINKFNLSSKDVLVSPSGGIKLNIFRERSLPSLDQLHIGFPAALNKHKGIDYLKLVIDNLLLIYHIIGKKTFIHIIRFGEECTDFISKIPIEVKERIIIDEMFQNHDIYKFYEKLHLSLFFSKRESLGLTVLESMACGVPVIARSNTSLIELVVPGLSGELVPNEPSFNDIVQAIIQIETNITSYNPRNKAEEYSYDVVVSQYRLLLKSFK